MIKKWKVFLLECQIVSTERAILSCYLYRRQIWGKIFVLVCLSGSDCLGWFYFLALIVTCLLGKSFFFLSLQAYISWVFIPGYTEEIQCVRDQMRSQILGTNEKKFATFLFPFFRIERYNFLSAFSRDYQVIGNSFGINHISLPDNLQDEWSKTFLKSLPY